MKNLLSILLCLCALSLEAQNNVSLYVSSSGSDRNPGTSKKPLATLLHAWQLASPMVGKQPVTIYCTGINYLQQPIRMTAEMTATAQCPVKICSAPGQRATLSSSSVLKELRWKPYRNGIVQTKVEALVHFEQLFVNGERQTLARYPNEDKTIHIYHGFAADVVSPERVKGWKNPTGGVLHAMHSREWGGYQYAIDGKDEEGKLKLSGGYQNNRQMGMHDTYRMVENVFEELDTPGEWYFDRETQTLYFYPPHGLNLKRALFEVPQAESLFIFEGTLRNPVSHVTIEDLTITQTLRTFMQTKEPLLRSDWCIYRGGAVIAYNAEHISVLNCHLHHLGGNALFFSGYNRFHRVQNNHLEHIAASAVCFVGLPQAVRSPLFEYGQSQNWHEMDKLSGPLTKDYPAQCVVDNNLIHDIGEIEKQGAGIQISMAKKITISQNSIYNLPRAGINISDGTWGGHLIEGNDVFNTVLETGDHGSFNSWGRDRFWSPNRKQMDQFVVQHPETILWDAVETTVIRVNRWRCDHGWDIDLDDGSSNYHIYNNLCLNGGLKLREGFARRVENNVIVNNSFHPHVWFKNSKDIFRHNIVTTPYRDIQVAQWGDKIDHNFFISRHGLEKARKQQTDSCSMTGDPLFVNPSKGDYRVKEDSPALKVGFRNFDMDRFGVQYAPLKALSAAPLLPDFLLTQSGEEEVQTYHWQGFVLKEVTTEGERSAAGLDKTRGVLVLKAGSGFNSLQANDVILTLNKREIHTWSDLEPELRKWRQGVKMDVVVMRDQQQLTIVL